MNEPIPIKLKAKYRRGFRSRYRSSSNYSGQGRRRNKIGYERHVARFGTPPIMVMRMTSTGRTYMEKVAA